jgi:hypothetical protein
MKETPFAHVGDYTQPPVPGPTVHACIFCLEWVHTHVPGMEFHVVVAEKMRTIEWQQS